MQQNSAEHRRLIPIQIVDTEQNLGSEAKVSIRIQLGLQLECLL